MSPMVYDHGDVGCESSEGVPLVGMDFLLGIRRQRVQTMSPCRAKSMI